MVHVADRDDWFPERLSALQLLNKHIAVLYRYTQAAMSRRLEPLGISAGQYPRLLFACREPGVSQDRMTAGLFYNKSSIARAIASLEAEGFLRREIDPADKRSYRVFPTEKAWAVVPVIQRELDAVTEELTAGFSPEEKELAGRLVADMARNAGEKGANTGCGAARKEVETI